MPCQGKSFVRKQKHGEGSSYCQHKDNGTGNQAIREKRLHVFAQTLRFVHCLQTHNQREHHIVGKLTRNHREQCRYIKHSHRTIHLPPEPQTAKADHQCPEQRSRGNVDTQESHQAITAGMSGCRKYRNHLESPQRRIGYGSKTNTRYCGKNPSERISKAIISNCF